MYFTIFNLILMKINMKYKEILEFEIQKLCTKLQTPKIIICQLKE